MATRFYMPSGGTAGSTPAQRSDWERSYLASTPHRPAPLTKSNTALTDVARLFGSTTTSQTHWTSFVSDPLDVNQTITGTFSMVVRGLEGAAQEDAHLAYMLRVMQGDTSTERGLLASSMTTGTEFATTAQTRIFNAVAVSSVAALAGDRIVLEIGIHGVTPADANNITLRFGDPTGTADFALTSGLTTDLVPWFELSQNLTFGAAGATGTVSAGALAVAGQAHAATADAPGTLAAGTLTVAGQAHTATPVVLGAVGTGSIAVSGQAVAGQAGAVGALATGALAVSGQAVAGTTGGGAETGTVASGALTVAGQGVAGTVAVAGALSAGALAVAGQAVTGVTGATGTVAAGALAVSGQAVAGAAGSTGVVAAGALAVSGQAVAGTFGAVGTVGTGAHAVSGQAVGSGAADGPVTGTVATGAHAVSGQAVAGRTGTLATLAAGTLAVGGQAVAGTFGAVGVVGTGAHAAVGQAVAAAVAQHATLAGGALAVAGQPIAGRSGATGVLATGALAVVGSPLTAAAAAETVLSAAFGVGPALAARLASDPALAARLGLDPALGTRLDLAPALRAAELIALPALFAILEVSPMRYQEETPYVGATQKVDVADLIDADRVAVVGATFVVTVTPPSGSAPTVSYDNAGDDYRALWTPAVAGAHTVRAQATAPGGEVWRGKTQVTVREW